MSDHIEPVPYFVKPNGPKRSAEAIEVMSETIAIELTADQWAMVGAVLEIVGENVGNDEMRTHALAVRNSIHRQVGDALDARHGTEKTIPLNE